MPEPHSLIRLWTLRDRKRLTCTIQRPHHRALPTLRTASRIVALDCLTRWHHPTTVLTEKLIFSAWGLNIQSAIRVRLSKLLLILAVPVMAAITANFGGFHNGHL